MSNAEQYWLHQQQNPDDILITGNGKIFKPQPRQRFYDKPGPPEMTGAEMAEYEKRREEEENDHLKKNGII